MDTTGYPGPRGTNEELDQNPARNRRTCAGLNLRERAMSLCCSGCPDLDHFTIRTWPTCLPVHLRAQTFTTNSNWFSPCRAHKVPPVVDVLAGCDWEW